MDTISVKIFFERLDLSMKEISWIQGYIENIKSPYGFNFCKKSRIDRDGITVKISYPRYFSYSNAFLITSAGQCKEVQISFCKALEYNNPFPFKILAIKLLRVDIPFTYHMKELEYFHNYKNIFKIFAMVYKEKNPQSCPKMISQILNEEVETLIYADTKVMGNYEKKIQIYNQYVNLESKLEKIEFSKVIEQFPDLSKRIRLEVTQKIYDRVYTLEQFMSHEIYMEYFTKSKKYLLENFFDMNIIDKFYETWAIVVANKLIDSRNEAGFNYENFMLKITEGIYDYEIIRKALEITANNEHTLEYAITRVRKVLREYQNSREIIIMGTYKHLKDMHKSLNRVRG